MLVHYQLVSSNAAGAGGQSTILPVRPGTIKLVVFRGYSLGAATTGTMSYELGYNQTQILPETQNPMRTATIAAHSFVTQVSAYSTIPPLVVPSNWPIRIGDQLCINSLVSGTAAAGLRAIIDVYVEEV